MELTKDQEEIRELWKKINGNKENLGRTEDGKVVTMSQEEIDKIAHDHETYYMN